jgi:hypothetical protein
MYFVFVIFIFEVYLHRNGKGILHFLSQVKPEKFELINCHFSKAEEEKKCGCIPCILYTYSIAFLYLKHNGKNEKFGGTAYLLYSVGSYAICGATCLMVTLSGEMMKMCAALELMPLPTSASSSCFLSTLTGTLFLKT